MDAPVNLHGCCVRVTALRSAAGTFRGVRRENSRSPVNARNDESRATEMGTMTTGHASDKCARVSSIWLVKLGRLLYPVARIEAIVFIDDFPTAIGRISK